MYLTYIFLKMHYPIKKKVFIEHGFTFQLQESRKVRHLHLQLKTWTIKGSYINVGWDQFIEFYLTHKKVGKEYLMKSDITMGKMAST